MGIESYSSAVQPASAIVQILGSLTGNFAQTVD
jgi:type IV secretory pathway VirB2 component (pilin)